MPSKPEAFPVRKNPSFSGKFIFILYVPIKILFLFGLCTLTQYHRLKHISYSEVKFDFKICRSGRSASS